nr:isoform 2 of cell division cycle 7-related protein kinase [Quercus suber]
MCIGVVFAIVIVPLFCMQSLPFDSLVLQLLPPECLSSYGIPSNLKITMLNSHLSISEPHHRLTTSVRDKSWQLIPILSRITGSARPEEERSSKRVLLDAPPDLVRYLCSIPGFPIHQSENGFVTVSMAAVSALFREFAAMAVFGGKVSRFGIRVLESDRVWDSNVKTYFRKRKRAELDGLVASMAKRRSSASISGNGENIMIRNMNSLKAILPPSKVELGVLNKETAISPVLLGSSSNFLRFPTTDLEHKEGKNDVGIEIIMCKEIPGPVNTFKFCNGLFKTETCSNTLKPMQVESITEYIPDLNLAPPISFQDPLLCEEALISDFRFRFQPGYTTTIFQEEDRQCNVSPTVVGKYDIHPCDVSMSQPKEDAETQVKISGKEGCTNFSAKGDLQNLIPSEKTNVTHDAPVNCLELRNVMDNITSDKDQMVKKVETQATFPIVEHCSTQKVLAKSSCRLKGLRKNAVPPEPRVVMDSLDHNKVVITPKQRDQCKSGQKAMLMEKNLKQNHNKNMRDKENMVDATNSITSTLEEKTFPHFESFIIEEEEGSGGYGTVYRARRKNDGKMFAIKCPHANAHKHHVNNELKMLEHFGGRNFIIKFEGSFQSGNNDCFVLEHVQHDRPEVLKKDIDVYQLQWYGYCLFRALACLHKQGVIHRDVKPGNFLFSWKLNKGYLIDFNLAMVELLILLVLPY